MLPTRRSVLLPRLTLACLVALGGVGCGTSQAVKSARRGDLPALRAALLLERPKDSRDIEEIARAILSRAVREAQGHEGRARVQGLAPCAHELVPALRLRAKQHDAVGAEAALLLFEDKNYRGPNPARFRGDPEGAWRALAARATEKDHAQRIAFFVDDDERVRRAALAAASSAGDERDVPALLEAARLDPDALTRSRAILALGRIGGERVLAALMDRYGQADEPTKLAIVDAYSRPGLATVGGWQRLERICDQESGFPALHAAALLSREPGARKARGLARLNAFLDSGTTEERRLAIRMAPAETPEILEKLVLLSEDPDAEVAVLARARLLGSRDHREDAERALLELARSDSSLSFQARAALAADGSPKVHRDSAAHGSPAGKADLAANRSSAVEELFVQQLSSSQAPLREVAGNGLLRLHAYGRLAPLLADEDEELRQTFACRVLAHAR